MLPCVNYSQELTKSTSGIKLKYQRKQTTAFDDDKLRKYAIYNFPVDYTRKTEIYTPFQTTILYSPSKSVESTLLHHELIKITELAPNNLYTQLMDRKKS